MEPQFVTAPEHLTVMRELMQREPVFHRPEFGSTREDFERMTVTDFWEVGASGRRYSRNFVIDGLQERFEKGSEEIWEMGDFQCREIAADHFLVTYTLIQRTRRTRRATIWRRTDGEWKVVYHQGTTVT